MERYEVGETVGVGGENRVSGVHLFISLGLLGTETRVCCFTGFAVVKRGRDKLTGEPVAIKVGPCIRFAAFPASTFSINQKQPQSSLGPESRIESDQQHILPKLVVATYLICVLNMVLLAYYV